MLTVPEAQALILQEIPLLGFEKVNLLSALGRVLAQEVASTRDIPPWDNSSMDGYAVRAQDTRGATKDRPARLSVVGQIPAGRMVSRPMGSGEAYRIMTGAPIPEGADAVIPVEDVIVEDEKVACLREVTPREFVRPLGEDVRRGDLVLSRGMRLTPAAIGLLAALGRASVQVYQQPRVAILSTGDELVEIEEPLGPGKIADSNTYTLMAQVRAAGAVPVSLGIARDTRESLVERFRSGLTADCLISSAGVSVGDHDRVRDALEQLGAQLRFWKVAMRPGKPLTFGLLQGKPVFGLPGNPVSSMVTFELFVRPALMKMMGHQSFFRPRARAVAALPIPNPGEREGYLRVSLRREGDRHYARLTGEQGSSILRSMVLADGLAVVPPDTTIPAGDDVDVILLNESLEN